MNGFRLFYRFGERVKIINSRHKSNYKGELELNRLLLQFINQESVIQVCQTYLSSCSLSISCVDVDWSLLWHSSGIPIVEWVGAPALVTITPALVVSAPALVTIAPALVTIAGCSVGCGSGLSRWLVGHGSTWGVYFIWILCLYSVEGVDEVIIVAICAIYCIQNDGDDEWS